MSTLLGSARIPERLRGSFAHTLAQIPLPAPSLRRGRLCSGFRCFSRRAGFGLEFEFDPGNFRNSSYFEQLAMIHFFVRKIWLATSGRHLRTPSPAPPADQAGRSASRPLRCPEKHLAGPRWRGLLLSLVRWPSRDCPCNRFVIYNSTFGWDYVFECLIFDSKFNL